VKDTSPLLSHPTPERFLSKATTLLAQTSSPHFSLSNL
jgi:hypothetical protein